jgi:hypothetical protein
LAARDAVKREPGPVTLAPKRVPLLCLVPPRMDAAARVADGGLLGYA